jgi:predicted dehydrogenase
MSEKFGFGIIGTGIISSWHAAGIKAHPDAQIVAVYNRTKSKAEEFAQKYRCAVYDDLNELLKRDDIHAVCVCTASGLHTEQSITALEAGKHVLVEKPMATNLKDATDMIRAARNNNLKLGVIFQKRTSSEVKRLKDAVADGTFGKIVFGDASLKYWRNQAYYDSGAWRGTWEFDGGGCSMNQGIHGIDILLYIMGVDVARIYAKIDTVCHTIEVEDVAVGLLTYKNGAYGCLKTATTVNPGQGNIIEINGTQGTAILIDDVITNWAVSDSKDVLAEEKLSQSTADVRKSGASSSTDFSTRGHIIQIENFVSAVRNEEPLICSGEEGRKSVHLIMALYESARRKEEVSLDELLDGLEL